MTKSYDDELMALRREVEIDGGRPKVIDAHVSRILGLGDMRFGGDLLLLLSDSATHDEGMFSLIHAAEALDNDAYVRALLAVFPRVARAAPRWGSIILMRVLNNSLALEELVRQLRHAAPPTKEVVREMCDRINTMSSQFLAKTMPVTLAAT